MEPCRPALCSAVWIGVWLGVLRSRIGDLLAVTRLSVSALLVPAHASSAAGRAGRCDRLSAEAVQVYEAVRFALRRINQNRGQVDGRIVSESFLPGVKLGQCGARPAWSAPVTRRRPTEPATESRRDALSAVRHSRDAAGRAAIQSVCE